MFLFNTDKVAKCLNKSTCNPLVNQSQLVLMLPTCTLNCK